MICDTNKSRYILDHKSKKEKHTNHLKQGVINFRRYDMHGVPEKIKYGVCKYLVLGI
jgi:hypothetical protein